MNKLLYKDIGETLYCDTLPNGLTLRLSPRPGFQRCHALFATGYGGSDRRFRLGGEWTDTPAGVAHFLEHKMFDTPDGGNALAVLSARGASPNAFTGPSMTAYHFDCTEGFEENLKTLLSFVSTPYFTPESVLKEQGIIGQEIRMTEDSPGFAGYMAFMGALFQSHPIRDSVAGTVESIAEITADTLYACHKVFYRPSNMTLCVVGDVNPDRVADFAMELLPKERGEVPFYDHGPAEGPLPVETRVSREMTVSAPQFLLGAKVPAGEPGGARQRLTLTAELALECLCGESSPFFEELRGQGLLDDGFGYELDVFGDVACVVLGGESRDPDRVRETLDRYVRDTAEKGFEKELFNRVKKAYYGQKLRGLDSFPGLARRLAGERFGDGCPLDAFAQLQKLTAGDCAAFAAEMLAPERLALSDIRPLS